jgi:2-polyprenyl-6-methoxyphenol hydroxylase-like FAD-dependent oxidoreductase
VLFLPQSETERLLIEHFASLGGRVERGLTLRAFRDDCSGVEAELDGASGTQTVRARRLIGCDGAHSPVHRLTNVPFVGDTVGLSFFLGDLELRGPDVPDDELRIYLRHRGGAVGEALLATTSRGLAAVTNANPIVDGCSRRCAMRARSRSPWTATSRSRASCSPRRTSCRSARHSSIRLLARRMEQGRSSSCGPTDTLGIADLREIAMRSERMRWCP